MTGWLDDPVAWRQIGEWIAAAGVCAGMRRNRLGVLGHYYGGMLDVYTDLTRQSAVFGTHVELLEMCELHALRERVTDAEVAGKIAEFRAAFEVSPECEQAELGVRRARRWPSTAWWRRTGWGRWPIITRVLRATTTSGSSPP